ncbi:DUF2637 domain-containing protein [Streptomyces yunnanensis]|uniref:DUF2637 domain-containing protein n=1 Tax=Streptomyces yunnanensis TaxID=156453 RepID=A0ABY8A8X0_9ACTN|nr:DUF2637 domain-containing protein [Streptomyces yunnanensis]WEB41238.1 DUF2637 domain-containing protein [Streptomyces yunnanensis]
MTTPSISHPPHPDEPGGERDAEWWALVTAGAVIAALTGGAFWLSYAHLAEVAGQHGLGCSPIRRWAWPATLDAFIVAGELLMLRAGLRQVTDKWAITVTVAGSIGSIALNVFGVNSTGNVSSVPFLDYVVAAVPPTAAMLAFAVLMRQIHQLVDRTTNRPEPLTGQRTEGAVQKLNAPSQELEPAAASTGLSDPLPVATAQPTEPSAQVSEAKPRGGRPPKATIEELAEIGRIAAYEHRKLTRDLLRGAVEDKGLTIGSERLTKVMKILRPELEAAGIAVSTSG